MGTASENRRQWLAHLVRQHGTVAALNRALERDERDATLNQILNEAPNSKTGAPRRMGDKLARSIEKKLGLGHGVMDREWHPTPFEQGFQAAIEESPRSLTELEQSALAALRGLTQEQQREVIEAMERTREANHRIVAELANQPGTPSTASGSNPPPRRVRPPLMPYPEPFGHDQTAAEPAALTRARAKRSG